MSVKVKPLHGFRGGEIGIAAQDSSGTCRAVYTVSIGDSIDAIHAVRKKPEFGIATPQPEVELVRQRLKQFHSRVNNAEKICS